MNPTEHVYCSGAGAMHTTVGATEIADRTANNVLQVHAPSIRLTSNAHGYLVGDAKKPSSLLIRGLANYDDGSHRLLAVDTNTIDIVTKNAFTASDTPAGTETINPGYICREKCDFVGFKLHLSAASGTAEDIEIHIDSGAGSTLDVKVYDYDMDGIQDIDNIFDPAIPLNAGDKVYVTWTNTDAETWGIELIFRPKGA